MSDETTFTTTTLIGNHVCMTEYDHDLLVGAVNIGIVATKENALLVEQLAAKDKEFNPDWDLQQATKESLHEHMLICKELQEENALLRNAFDEVCCDIRNHAPNYVHPAEDKAKA